MKDVVRAVLNHVASSKEKPMQESCPIDAYFWFGFQRDPGTHKHNKGLPDAVVEAIQPIFDSLS